MRFFLAVICVFSSSSDSGWRLWSCDTRCRLESGGTILAISDIIPLDTLQSPWKDLSSVKVIGTSNLQIASTGFLATPSLLVLVPWPIYSIRLQRKTCFFTLSLKLRYLRTRSTHFVCSIRYFAVSDSITIFSNYTRPCCQLAVNSTTSIKVHSLTCTFFEANGIIINWYMLCRGVKAVFFLCSLSTSICQ